MIFGNVTWPEAFAFVGVIWAFMFWFKWAFTFPKKEITIKYIIMPIGSDDMDKESAKRFAERISKIIKEQEHGTMA